MPHAGRGGRPTAVGLVAVSLAGLIWYCASLRSRPAPSLGELVALPGTLDDCRRRDAELERSCQLSRGRRAARDGVIHLLLAGQVTLSQAAVRFRAVEREYPPVASPRRPAGGMADDERLCRDVLRWADQWVEAHLPAERDRVAARLDAGLEELRGSDGTVRLPDR